MSVFVGMGFCFLPFLSRQQEFANQVTDRVPQKRHSGGKEDICTEARAHTHSHLVIVFVSLALVALATTKCEGGQDTQR